MALTREHYTGRRLSQQGMKKEKKSGQMDHENDGAGPPTLRLRGTHGMLRG